MRGKRGISGVVVSVLLILLTVSLVAILWVGIASFTSESGEGINLGKTLTNYRSRSGTGGGDTVSCTINSDCNAGEVCNFGVCEVEVVDECSIDGDCNAGEVCNSGVCESNGGDPECLDNNDCPGTEVCNSGVCEAVSGTGDHLFVGMNLAFVRIWSLEIPFSDVMRMGMSTKYGAWRVYETGDFSGTNYNSVVRQPLMNKDRYPIEAIPYEAVSGDGSSYYVGTGIYAGMAENKYPVGKYHVIYDGTGKILINGGTGNEEVSIPNQLYEFDVEQSSNGISIFISESNPVDPVRNIKIILPGMETTYETEWFNPLFLERLEGVKIIRFMDWMNTNSQGIISWDDRNNLSSRGYGDSDGPGVSVEYMVNLANTAGIDPWFNMPHKADDNYVRNFSTYVRDNINSDRKVYVEYSNEAWNPGAAFTQNGWVWNKYSGSGWTMGERIAEEADIDLKIWKEVFAETNQLDQLKRVAAGRGSDPNTLNTMLTRLYEKNPSDGGFDVISEQAYFGVADWMKDGSYDGSTTPEEIATDAISVIIGDRAERWTNRNTTRSEWEATLGKKIEYIAYEGGQHLTAFGIADIPYNKSLIDAQRIPLMYDAYKTMFNVANDAGMDGINLFDYVGSYGKYGSWGHLEYLNQTISKETTPKYWAMQEAIDGTIFN